MKTPGTHADDDRSQQPRQTETPAKPEKSAIDSEDHARARDKLVEEKCAPKKPRSGPRE